MSNACAKHSLGVLEQPSVRPRWIVANETFIVGISTASVLADFANPDNTDRTGSAAALSGAVAAIVETARSLGGAVVVTGGRDATNSFPLVYVNDVDPGATLRDEGRCGDLAPTLLELLQLPRPRDVEGVSLLVR